MFGVGGSVDGRATLDTTKKPGFFMGGRGTNMARERTLLGTVVAGSSLPFIRSVQDNVIPDILLFDAG